MASAPKTLTPAAAGPADRESLPPLENGDHLDQKTFHARYEAMLAEIQDYIVHHKFDVIVTHENDCQFSNMAPIREHYEQRGPELLMRYAFGGSRMQFWYPKQTVAPAK